jgi:hypothetical protein
MSRFRSGFRKYSTVKEAMYCLKQVKSQETAVKDIEHSDSPKQVLGDTRRMDPP